MAEQLNAYSQQIAGELFGHFPEWERYLQVETEDGESSLTVEVPSPNGTQFGPLGITTKYNAEVTVYFGGYHRHLPSLLPSSEVPEGAFRWIEGLLNEELVLVQYEYRGIELIGDGWHHGCLFKPGAVPVGNFEHHHASRMRVSSWRGTFDREFEAPYIKQRPVS